MTGFLKRVCLAVVVAVFVLSTAAVCFAQDPFTKLGRGVANTLTGWVELPKNVYSTSVEQNALAGMTVGLAKGAGMSIVRTSAGIYEIATFPFPLPQDYKPILEPEYVF
ncbi:MAG: exosortase system-associated protein, TIGR04073 family [Candidatus Omnitrophica bacterium]|nr:exosortase system-associated protein, TIGR04073 family [Candidatus Omnitrophota bacterium]